MNMKSKAAFKGMLLALALMLAMTAAVRYDAPRMSAHSGGELSAAVMVASLLAAAVPGIRAVRKKQWLCAVMMAMVLLFAVGCDRWLWLQTPPCPECEPAQYAEWIEDTDKG